MRSTVVLVDGYNVLMFLAHLDKYPGYDFAVEREYFLRLLEKKKPQGEEWIVVFDGTELHLEREKGLWVIFSPKDEEADDVILEFVAGKNIGETWQLSTANRRIYVVTDDKKLRRRIRAIRPEVGIRGVGFLN